MSYATLANAITHKTQKAAQAMYQSSIALGTLDLVTADQVFAGIGPSDVTATHVVCTCRRADAEEIFDGNWTAELSIEVRAPAGDYTDEDVFHELCGGVFAQFFQDPATVTAELSNATVAYTAFAVYPRSQEWERDGDRWASRLTVTVKCCGSVVS